MIQDIIKKYFKIVIIFVIIGIIISLFVIPQAAVAMYEKNMMNFKEYYSPISKMFKCIGESFGGVAKEKYNQILGYFWFIYIVTIVILWVKKKSNNGYDGVEHGSSDWAKFGEQYDDIYGLNKNSGIILAEKNYLPLSRRGNLNVLIAGGSGSGKSAAYVIPNATQLLGSYIFTDPKGELYEKTSGFFRAHGYKVRTFNLVKTEYSDSYNPLLHIRNEKDVDIIANTVVKGQSKKGGSDPFWEDMAETLLKALIYYLMAARPPEEQSLASCANLVRAADLSSGESLLDKLMAELPEEHPAVKNYKSVAVAGSDKVLGSIFSTLQSKLTKFDSGEIQRVTNANTIDFEEIGREKVVLYVISSDTDDSYNFIMTIFFSQLIQQLYDMADSTPGKKLNQLVLFILDEFANIGQIPSFEQKISTSRSRNIAFSVILQTLDQLTDIYKDSAETIMANCDTHLFLGSNSLKTAEHFSKALGEKTITRDSISKSKDKDNVKSGTSESDQIMARALMTTDEIRRLNPDKDIILLKGIKPVLGDKYYYFKKPIYKEIKECMKDDIFKSEYFVKGEGKIFNPFEKEKNETELKNLDFNMDFSDNEKSKKNTANRNNPIKEDISVDLDVDENDDIPQIVSSKKKKDSKNDFNYDIQKELEAKFDELFGDSDDE